MRVAIFVGTFPVVSETFILRQITGLIDLGHEVTIFAALRPDAQDPVHPEVGQYDLPARTVYLEDHAPAASVYWEMPAWPLSGETWVPGAAEPLPNRARAMEALPALTECGQIAPHLVVKVLDPAEYGHQAPSLSALYRLHLLVRHVGRFDLAHVHFGEVANGWRFVRALWGVPLVVSFHGFDFTTVPRLRGRDVYRSLFGEMDAAVANSAFTSRRLVELGCPPDKLHLIPVGLRPEDFPFAERRLVAGEPVRVLTVARLVEIKGHEFAIRAMAEVRRTHRVQYDIIGDGPLRPKLQELIDQLGLRDVVRLHGAQAAGAVRSLMARAHLFVLGSVSIEGDQEGQGLVLQEAQASGLPVVATNHGAFPEGLLDGQSGFLVPERDVGALAARLSDLIDHNDRWPEIGRSGREYVQSTYDVRRLNRELVQLYQQLERT